MVALQKFTSPIVCEISNDGRYYTLARGFYYYRKNFKYERIIVPKGFKSDGFTNLGFDLLVRKYGKGLKCAILHDYLCDCAHAGLNTRKFADDIFLESMLETRAFCKAKAYFLYFCVRAYAKFKKMK